MRIIIVITVLGISALVLGYNLSNTNDPSRLTQLRDSEASAASGPTMPSEVELAFLTDRFEEYQRNIHEQLYQTQLQQARLSELLESLDARLQSIERTAKTEVTSTIESNPVYTTPKPGQVTDADMGRWMDDSLHAGYHNDGLTSLATDQAIASLEKAPGVSLDEMRCADRFCRATFSHVNGEQPVIDRLFGEPPFVNEGFTIVQPDGRVTLYFNQPGESLAELRGEVGDSPGYWDYASEDAGWR